MAADPVGTYNDARASHRPSSLPKLLAAPLVRPCIFRPCVIPRFAGTRNGMERPAQFPGPHIVGANVARRRGKSLGVAATDNRQIFVHDSRARHINRLRGRWTAVQISADRCRPCSPKLGIGAPVTKHPARTQNSSPRPGCVCRRRYPNRRGLDSVVPCTPESNFHKSLPVAASSANTFCVGVSPYSIAVHNNRAGL